MTSARTRDARKPQETRVERLAVELRELELDVLLVGAPVDVRYLTGFTGSNGLALIAAHADGPQRFFTDFRYATQSAEQVPAAFEREVVTIELLEAAAGRLAASAPSGGRLGFDEAALTVKQHVRLGELLPAGWELVGCAGVAAALREVKDSEELGRIRAAAQLADEALRGILEQGLVGRTERDVAIDLELAMRRLGAEGPSFPSIVAAAEHSALPHAEPRAVAIPRDTLVTIDWGAVLDGYCSDCTRMFATGVVTDDALSVYELVRRAQAESQAAVRAGPTGRELDSVARTIIEQGGHGEHFGHGLGHGVGLEIHEGPRLSRTAGEQALRAGNVVTVEPGVYLPGRFGVRIEDLVIVTEDGSRSLSGLPKELAQVA